MEKVNWKLKLEHSIPFHTPSYTMFKSQSTLGASARPGGYSLRFETSQLVELDFESKMRRRTISKIVNRFDTGNYQLPPDYQALVDSDRSICFRGLWFCVVFICLSGSCYQIWERILYYMSYPTAVDFEIGEVLSLKILTTQTCSGENDYVMDLLYDLAKSDPISCFIPAVKIWKMSKPVDYEKFWDYKNESISIDKVEFKNVIKREFASA
uniref:Uncharacterized protein n=1 Tax=Strigamia maritima TaxID=126957 RepID=T1JI58_STRMM